MNPLSDAAAQAAIGAAARELRLPRRDRRPGTCHDLAYLAGILAAEPIRA